MYLRDRLKAQFGKIEEIAEATGIELNDLRRFGIGSVLLEPFDLDLLAKYFNVELTPIRADMLPLEGDASEGIRQIYAEHFDILRSTIAFALEVIGSASDGSGSLPEIKKPRGLSWPAVHIVLGAYTKIVKQARAIFALCEIGLVKDASAIERCMFEAMLCLLYFLKPRIPITENGKKLTHVQIPSPSPGKGMTVPPPVTVKLKKLTTQLRCTMYVAHDTFQLERELDAYIAENRPDLVALLGDQKMIRKTAKAARRTIGKGWAFREKTTKTYTGVSIRDLARSYGFLHFYLSVYRRQSKTVHGLDADDFVDTEDGLKLDLGPSPEHMDSVLFLATALLACTIDTVNDRFGFGFDQRLKDLNKMMKERGQMTEA